MQRRAVGYIDELGVADDGYVLVALRISTVEHHELAHAGTQPVEPRARAFDNAIRMLERGRGWNDNNFVRATARQELLVEGGTRLRPLAATDECKRPLSFRHEYRSYACGPRRLLI